MFVDVVPSWVTEYVQYLLYNQLPLTVEAFWRVNVTCIGGLVCAHSCDCIVKISLEMPCAKLALKKSVYYSTAIHLAWNKDSILRLLISLISIFWQRIANGDKDIYFWPIAFKNGDGCVKHRIGSKVFEDFYNDKRIEMISSAEKDLMCNENFENWEKCFVRFTQIFLSKAETIVKSSALAVYPVHVVLLNFSTQFQRSLILRVLTLIAFLLVAFYSSYIEEEHEEHDRDQLSLSWFSYPARVPRSDSVWLALISTAPEKRIAML